MPTNTEQTVNVLLGNLIRARVPKWSDSISVEQTNVIEGASGQSPDLLIYGASTPVVIEAEFLPANTVMTDARKRLGQVTSLSKQPIEHVLACRYQADLRQVDQRHLTEHLESSTFGFQIFSTTTRGESIWPEQGYCEGSINDLVDCLELIELSDSLLDECTNILEVGIEQVERHVAVSTDDVAKVLHQEACPQTDRMAAAIIANAMMFHLSLEKQTEVPKLSDLIDEDGDILWTRLRGCWTKIITQIDYWPVFSLAGDLLASLTTIGAAHLVNHLYHVCEKLARRGALSMNDLCGRIFQKLIVDRKFLATFYTLPVSATLLSELIAERMTVNWQDPDEVKSLRVGDWACGTGTLISAMYQSILCRYRKFHDDREIHGHMIENSLFAFDVMPVATHLAASTLASAHPGTPFNQTNIVTMPYGTSENFEEPQLGSLELIFDESFQPLFSMGRSALRGNPGTQDLKLVGDESVDVIIMNPPFTRPTNHERLELNEDIPVPSFAGLGNSPAEQRAMSARLKKVLNRLEHREYMASNGNAGIATNFIDLAHAKLAMGGTLGLILPFTFAQGEAWRSARNLLMKHYTDIHVLAIAATGSTDCSFSADTGMAEVLLVATKCTTDSDVKSKVRYTNLNERPRNQVEAIMLARQFSKGRLQSVSELNTTSVHDGGAAGVRNVVSLHRTMAGLKDSQLLLPHGQSAALHTVNLGVLGKRGLLSRDLNGSQPTKQGLPRGPFDVLPISKTSEFPDYPILWAHNSKNENRLKLDADRLGVPRSGSDQHAVDVWEAYATRLHINVDFRLNSQPLAAAITESRTLGGQAWPNFVLEQEEWEIPCLIWLNSSLGLMYFWWIGTRQQTGRSRISLSRHTEIITLDPRQLSQKQLQSLDALYEELLGMSFLPANEAYRDDVRKYLDKVLLCDVLSLPAKFLEELEHLRNQWCAEPSVHGGKSTQLHDPNFARAA